MTEFFFDYGLFLAKAVTIVAAVISLVIVSVVLASRSKGAHKEHIEIEKLNDQFQVVEMALKSAMLNKQELKELHKEMKAKQKAEQKKPVDESRQRVFVIDFDGDIRASEVTSLREEISAVLAVAKKTDEVFVKLTSAGGMVHSYGLAASQLARLRTQNIPLTVAVDKVAASGGYMMACVADRILAAPFAVMGSIGVLAQIPNFNRLLKKHDIDYEQITAGEYKRTLTMFGENTDKGRAKFKEDIEDTHDLFKDFVSQYRPVLDMEKVATGEHWFGTRALDLNLVDELKTSDDYLMERSKQADLYRISYTARKTLGTRFAEFFGQVGERFLAIWGRQAQEQRYSG